MRAGMVSVQSLLKEEKSVNDRGKVQVMKACANDGMVVQVMEEL
jgi:hypothetical protein